MSRARPRARPRAASRGRAPGRRGGRRAAASSPRPTAGPATPAATRSSPPIAGRTWRTSPSHRRARSGCAPSAPASATVSARSWRSAARSAEPVSAPAQRGRHRPGAARGRGDGVALVGAPAERVEPLGHAVQVQAGRGERQQPRVRVGRPQSQRALDERRVDAQARPEHAPRRGRARPSARARPAGARRQQPQLRADPRPRHGVQRAAGIASRRRAPPSRAPSRSPAAPRSAPGAAAGSGRRERSRRGARAAGARRGRRARPEAATRPVGRAATASALTVKSRRRRSSPSGGRLDARQRTRRGVALAARARDVEADPGARRPSRSRSGRAPRTRRRAARRPARPRQRVALDDEVELARARGRAAGRARPRPTTYTGPCPSSAARTGRAAGSAPSRARGRPASRWPRSGAVVANARYPISTHRAPMVSPRVRTSTAARGARPGGAGCSSGCVSCSSSSVAALRSDDVSQPEVQFRSRRTRRRARETAAAQRDGLRATRSSGPTTATPRTAALPAGLRSLRPPFHRAGRSAAPPARVPARSSRPASSCSRTTARSTPRQAHRQDASGSASSGTSPPPRPPRAGSVYITVLERGRARTPGASPRSGRDGQDALAAHPASRTESSPVCRRRAVYFGSEDGTRLLPGRAATARCTGPTGRAARSRPARRCRTACSTSATTAGRVHAVRRATGTARGLRGRAGAASAWRRPLLLDARGRLRPRLPRQHGRQGLLVLVGQRQARLVACRPAATSMPPPPSPTCRARPDRLHRLLRRHLLRARRRTGRKRWTHRAGGKISGRATVVGDIVYFANLDAKKTTVGPRRPAPAARCSTSAAALQPRRLRRQGASTLRRAYVARVYASSARAAKRKALTHADGHAGGRQAALGLGHATLAVVEDRRREHGVGAGVEASTRCSSVPAPPEAITGTSTADEIAPSSARS